MELFSHILSRNSKDISQHFKSLQKAIASFLNQHNSKSQKAIKELEKAKKDIHLLSKLIFDSKKYNEDLFEMLMSKPLILFLTDSLQVMPLTYIIFPLISKILFENNNLLQSIGLNEEILLMNTNIIGSIKIMIKKFIEIISINSKESFIEDQMLHFIHLLMDKLILYPNFYFAISSSNEGLDGNFSFESHLFKLIVNLFAIEPSFTQRESKAIIRKGLMKCLNLENFDTVKRSIIIKLLECLVSNLISYYNNFVLFDLNKWLSMNDLPKGASGEDIKILKKEDAISYLKFFSMITHCFATKELKNFLSNIIVNYFLCDEIQKDIITLGNNLILDQKLKRVLEFLYLLTEYINNYEISEMIFYFLFGFNNYYINEEDNIGSDNLEENYDNEDNIEHMISLDEENNQKNTNKKSMTDGVSASKIADNINIFLRQSSNCKEFANNLNTNIPKTKHNFESIIAFFMLIIESNDSETKSFLMQTLTNIAKNTPYVFMTEFVVPYYLNYLSNEVGNNPSQYEALIEKVKLNRDKIEILEILKLLHPKNFSINSSNWIDHFEAQLTQNYKLNMNILNRIDNATPNLDNSGMSESLTRDINFINVQMNSSLNIEDYSTMRILQSEFGMDETRLNIDNTMTQMITNYTINLRIHFFEILISAFKKFATNKYTDNLYYSQFFLEVCSLPYAVNKGEIGDHIYNIYSNITFANRKNKILLKTGFVGLMYSIKNKLDEKIRLSYTQEEIDRFASFRQDDKKTNEQLNSNNLKTTKDKDFFDNVRLYNEIFKEFIMNIFTKVCIDQVNFCWGKKVMSFSNENN